MKKVWLFILTITALLTGCTVPQTINPVVEENTTLKTALMHHNYVLIDFNGKVITPQNMSPRISFNENFNITSVICISFVGQGVLNNDILKVTNMIRSQTVCFDEEKNQLDKVVEEMLTQGAKLSLHENTLILSNKNNKLTFILRDWVY